MTGRIYNLPLARTAVTVAVDLIEILTAATHIVEVMRIELSQSTDVKDAEEEMLQLAWKSGQTVSGSGGASVTPVSVPPGGASSGLTVEAFNTTKAGTGTIYTESNWDWNIRIPFQQIFIPEEALIILPATRATLELVAAPGDSITITGKVVVRIFGN